MDFYYDIKINKILKNDYRIFKRELLDEDDSFYNLFITKPEKMFNLFIFSICANNKVFTTVYKKLVDGGCKKKDLNEFFYKFFKMKYKSENGLWSWNEINELDIEMKDIKKTSTKYCFI